MIALIRAGAKSADLPVQTPTKYELVVNQAPRYLIRDLDGAYARSSSEDCDPWAFVFDRRRRARPDLGVTQRLPVGE